MSFVIQSLNSLILVLFLLLSLTLLHALADNMPDTFLVRIPLAIGAFLFLAYLVVLPINFLGMAFYLELVVKVVLVIALVGAFFYIVVWQGIRKFKSALEHTSIGAISSEALQGFKSKTCVILREDADES